MFPKRNSRHVSYELDPSQSGNSESLNGKYMTSKSEVEWEWREIPNRTLYLKQRKE